MRITFNEEFLPIKVEGYYDNEKGNYWEFLRKISYPYISKAAFNRKLKDYIDRIKDVEREEQAEEEAENRE